MSQNDLTYYLLCLSLLIYLPTATLADESYDCPSSYLNCGDGNCVSFLFLCDGENDCRNGVDEQCNGTVHKEKKLVCDDSKFSCPGIDICLPNKWKCDGHIDCPNGFDEKNCTKEIKCNGFKCKTGECIPTKWKCDNNYDCQDGSDEENCRSSRINPFCTRENGYFECASGKCISHDKVCNGHKDCPGEDDEGQFCNIDGCHAKNCTHGCFQTPQGPQCDCNDGFKLALDQRTCVDKDECAESNNNLCSHDCLNLKGSFICTCENGFKIVNKTKCQVQSEEPVLIYTDSHNIRGYWLNQRLNFLIAHSKTSASGIDMHRESKLVFWTDIGHNVSYVYSAHFYNKDVKPVVTSGLVKPEDIAVDYVSNNIYITDAGLKQIIVCKIDGSTCAPIVKTGIENIRAIALDVQNGRMFWTDWGLYKPGIYTARMDGTEVRTLVNRNIVWPNGLTYDRYKNRIYWSDAKLERIEYYDLNTEKRYVLIDDSVYHPHCLTMFEDDLYWADWDVFSISKSNKFTGHNMTSLFRSPDKIYGMHIYHPVHYTSTVNPCWSASCSHLCLITSPSHFKCKCPNHMKLDPKDRTTCIDKDDSTYLLISGDKKVKKVWPNDIGKEITKKLITKNLPVDNINEFTFSHRSNELFLYYSQKPGIYKYNLNSNKYSVIYDKNSSSIFDLTYDEFSNNLYWLDIDKSELVVASIDGKNKMTLINNLRHPASLALYQERNELFIGLMGDHNSILIADLDGKNSKTLVSDIGLPTSLAVCKKKNLLYWADAKKGTIESISINDSTSKTIVLSGLGNIESLIIKDQILYWIDMDSPTLLYSMSLTDNKKKIIQKSIGDYTTILRKKLVMVNKDTIENDCLNIKNKCSDICLFKGFKTNNTNNENVALTHCVCPSGTSLSLNQSTCEHKKHCPDGFFTCHSSKQCIRQSEVCDGHKNCPENEDEYGCPDHVPCANFESPCDPKNLTSICIPNSWFCDGEADCPNGFDELNCHVNANKSIYADVAHKSTVNEKCDQGYFKCDQNVCIPWHFVCNGEFNCADKSDESANCLKKCQCKNNGKCYLGKDKTWECQCSPEWMGRDCNIKNDLGARSNEHQLVMKESLYTKGRISKSEDLFSSSNYGNNSFWLMMLIVLIVLVVIVIVISGYIYMYETDGRLQMIKRNFNRKLNFRNNSFRKTYDFNSATVDLLDQMEGEPQDEHDYILSNEKQFKESFVR